jgi:hypothetical protein
MNAQAKTILVETPEQLLLNQLQSGDICLADMHAP